MFVCPVCGYDRLSETPYDEDGNHSYEICPCCGFEFGFDDDSKDSSFEVYRKEWIKKETIWFNEKIKPDNWDIKQQLRNIDIKF